jgi:hypothetical protein
LGGPTDPRKQLRIRIDIIIPKVDALEQPGCVVGSWTHVDDTS